MFRCDKCHKITEPHEKPIFVVMQTRPKTYINVIKKSRGEHQEEVRKESTGREIVEEQKWCDTCILMRATEQRQAINMVKDAVGGSLSE